MTHDKTVQKNIQSPHAVTISAAPFDEHAFAMTIKHALNESAQQLPQSTLDKLYAARRIALKARHTPSNPFSKMVAGFRTALAPLVQALGAPLAFAAPALVVGVGLYILSDSNAENYVQTVADIDSQVLTQELPINALLDKGFVRYVQVGE